MSPLSRRRFLEGAAALGLTGFVGPPDSTPRRTPLPVSRAPDPRQFSSGVASFDPTHTAVLLWTRTLCNAGVRCRIRPAEGFRPGPHAGLFDLPRSAVHEIGAATNDDGTVTVDAHGLEPATDYWYQFRVHRFLSIVGRTRTLPDPSDPRSIRLASTSCQSWQDGHYAAWWDIARQDLDLVLCLGDYIYEYPTAPAGPATVRRYRAGDDPDVDDGDDRPLGETISLADYRQRYRIHRSDPALRRAHRTHPFVCVWDDHEIASDRWRDGAQGHSNDDGTPDGSWAARRAAAVQAYFEYLPARSRSTGTVTDPDRGLDVYRTIRLGGLASLTLIDQRTYRDQPQGGFNRDFDPRASLDEHAYSAEGRTMLGAQQKDWLQRQLRSQEDTTVPWKLIGNSTMISALNYASLPDALGRIVAETTADMEGAPVTYHRDGIPVNGDQWDGYQAERRELLAFIRDGGTSTLSGAHEQASDLTPDAGYIEDVVFLAGDIHIGWSNEVHVDWGDAPADDPVAIELVCPGISSENVNERIGNLTIGRPLPEGTTNRAGPAAMALNPHVRYVDLDANGYVLVTVAPTQVITQQRVLRLPHRASPTTRPVEYRHAPVADAISGRWYVHRGASRLLPHPA